MRNSIVLIILELSGVSLFAQIGTTTTTRFQTLSNMVLATIPAIPTDAKGRITALVTGRTAGTNDGGGGIFFYDPESTAATNFGTIFKPSGTTGRWIRQYDGPLNARWFGVMTNNTAALNTQGLTNALQVSSNSGTGNNASGVVFIPGGSYTLNSFEIPSADITLTGAGPALAYDEQNADTGTILIASGHMDNFIITANTVNSSDNRIMNLTVEGNGFNVRGIKMWDNTRLINVRVQNCLIVGAYVETAADSFIENCSFLGNGVGLCITNGVDSSTRFTIENSIFRQNLSHGLLIEEGLNAEVSNCIFESNTGNGVKIYKFDGQQIAHIVFRSSYWENNGAAAVTDNRYQLLINAQTLSTTSGPTYLTFDNCYFNSSNATQRDLQIYAVVWCKFWNCNFAVNGGAVAADTIQLGGNASAVFFLDKEGAPTPIAAGYGNRGFEIQSDRSGDGGWDFLDGNGTVHVKAARLIATNYIHASIITNSGAHSTTASGQIRMNDGDINLEPPAGNYVRVNLTNTGGFHVQINGLTNMFRVTTNEVVVNGSLIDTDFRVAADGNANLFKTDAEGNGRISIGTTASTTAYIKIGGTWTPDFAGGTQYGLDFTTSVAGVANASFGAFRTAPTLVEAASGTHPYIAANLFDSPTVTGGAALVTDAATVYIAGPPSATVTGGNFALATAGGDVRFNNDGGDYDFIIEGDDNANLVNIDGSTAERITLGTTLDDTSFLRIGGSAPTGLAGGEHNAVEITSTVTGLDNTRVSVYRIAGTVAEGAGGTHSVLAGSIFDSPNVTGAGAAVTDAATIYINAAPNASGAVNHAFFVDSGATTLDGPLNLKPSSTQTIAAGTAILANAGSTRVAGSGGAVTVTAAPTIADGTVDGQIIYVMGTSAANTVTIQDEGGLAGSNLQLGAATRALGEFSVIALIWDATGSAWREISFAAN